MNCINKKESVPVKIGDFTVYCEKFKSSGVKNFSEQNTVSGNEIITNSGKKAVRITFSGRICNKNPLEFLVKINQMMYSTESFSIEYKETVFGKCHLQSFIVNDENNGYISATVTLIATEISLKGVETS
ncbi:MAG: hypothetical protein K2J36_07655 [Ruminococcus sp.]|nr:hypothetical protein [Ruminococcus sp.]